MPLRRERRDVQALRDLGVAEATAGLDENAALPFGEDAEHIVAPVGVGAALSTPFLVAGTLALALAAPLFLTSSRWSQHRLGMRRWGLLHKATYVIAAALMAHVVMIGDIGPGFVRIALGFVSRIPAVKRWIQERTERRRASR